MKVLSLFLESNDDYCVILEDDVLFINNGVEILNKIITSPVSQIDILQFGYLSINNRLDSGIPDSHFRLKSRFERMIRSITFTLINKFTKFQYLKVRINRANRILEILKLNEKILGLTSPLVEGFEAGTHCYLISRRGAQVLLTYNKPMLMVADLSLIILSVARNLLIVRTTLSYATQDDSPVSTGEHSRLKFDLGTTILSGQ
jgi:GR25 family glycosyltransferase involved in LPS biosynthesis